MTYISKEAPGPDETTRDAIRRRLAETAEKEQWNGQTLVGPHRDDIAFVSAGRDLSGFASRGQQRTAILAYKLATLDLVRRSIGRPPLLLLDDVFSELDPIPARPSRAPDRRAAAGVRHNHDGGRSRSGARRGRDRVEGHARGAEPCLASTAAQPPKRVGDVLPAVAAELGIDGQLRFARQLAAWQRIVAERVPGAAGSSSLLSLQPPALVVSATSPIVAQEIRLRQSDLLDAFAQAPEGQKLIELRVVVRPAG